MKSNSFKKFQLPYDGYSDVITSPIDGLGAACAAIERPYTTRARSRAMRGVPKKITAVMLMNEKVIGIDSEAIKKRIYMPSQPCPD